MTNSLSLKHGLSICCPQSSFVNRITPRSTSLPFSRSQRNYVVSSSAFANENQEFFIVGGGNTAGYAAKTFVEHGMADGKLCMVCKEGFHTCVGYGRARQTPDWYKEQGIEDPVTRLDIKKKTLITSSGRLLKYGALIISTGCTTIRRKLLEKMSCRTTKARRVVIVGGGYIGMEVAAAAVAWKLDTTIIFPEDNLLPRLFTPSLARRYEELYQENGVKFLKGSLIKNTEAGSDGHVAAVKLENGSTIEADTIIICVGAKPAVQGFEAVGLDTKVGGIQVDGLFQTNVPGIFAIGDVAAFPLKIYDKIARVEHVDHARKSAQHCVKALLGAYTQIYDYLPYFYSRVFEYEGSARKVWWQFYGENVGEAIEVGHFDPKIATFWVDSGKLKGVFLESGSSEEFQLLPRLARSQPMVDKVKLQNASSVEEALQIAQSSLETPVAV